MASREGEKRRKITPELCDAYRETLETKINGMEKGIKLAIAICGFVISMVVLITNYLL